MVTRVSYRIFDLQKGGGGDFCFWFQSNINIGNLTKYVLFFYNFILLRIAIEGPEMKFVDLDHLLMKN